MKDSHRTTNAAAVRQDDNGQENTLCRLLSFRKSLEACKGTALAPSRPRATMRCHRCHLVIGRHDCRRARFRCAHLAFCWRKASDFSTRTPVRFFCCPDTFGLPMPLEFYAAYPTSLGVSERAELNPRKPHLRECHRGSRPRRRSLLRVRPHAGCEENNGRIRGC